MGVKYFFYYIVVLCYIGFFYGCGGFGIWLMVVVSVVGWLYVFWLWIGWSYSDYLILFVFDMFIKDMMNMFKVDFSKCFVEVDVVEMSMLGKE